MAAAAASFESPNKTWQRVAWALAGASPAAQAQFKALKMWLSTQKGNPQLQFLPFNAAGIITATGQALVGSAVTLYGVYSKKLATATDVYLVIFDDATDDAGAATDARVVLPHLVSGDEAIYIGPQGIAMPSGVVAKAYTDFDGTTDSAVGDAPNGFCIIGS